MRLTSKGNAMTRILGLVLAIAVIVCAVPYARGLGAPSSPPGVSSSDWIPLGDTAGFVITDDKASPGKARTPPGTVKGYFMVRRTNSWLRVDSAPDYEVRKAVMQP
jgi:hypothetical protein